jgi:hypothetical protein
VQRVGLPRIIELMTKKSSDTPAARKAMLRSSNRVETRTNRSETPRGSTVRW